MHGTRRRTDFGRRGDNDFRPYRDLAVRVLACAFRDLTETSRSSDRDSARVFLAGSGLMRHWCRVANLDPICVANHAERVTANTRRDTHAPPRK
jgi:hypothetical protein